MIRPMQAFLQSLLQASYAEVPDKILHPEACDRHRVWRLGLPESILRRVLPRHGSGQTDAQAAPPIHTQVISVTHPGASSEYGGGRACMRGLRLSARVGGLDKRSALGPAVETISRRACCKDG